MESTGFPSNLRLGVIGGGNMAKSILFPLIDQGLLDPKNVMVGGNTAKTLEPWLTRGCSTVQNDNSKVLEFADVNVWAVKPQMFSKVVAQVKESGLLERSKALHISFMAGFTLEKFITKLDEMYHIGVGSPTVRTMPNIAHRVGAGCTVFTLGQYAKDEHRKIVQSLFSPTGICLEVPESQISGFSALTGAGIAFFCPVLEAMSDGAVKVGIPRELALEMAAQTMKGVAELHLKEKIHPGPLKDLVCSPGGSTIAGIAELEKAGVRIGFINAIDATVKRSAELGKLD